MIIIFLLLLFNHSVGAQKGGFSYQAIFIDIAGDLLREKVMGVGISLISEINEVNYSERHQVKTNQLRLTICLFDYLWAGNCGR